MVCMMIIPEEMREVANAFVQCGCMQKTLEEWEKIGETPQSIRQLHDDQPALNIARAYIWWRKNAEVI